MRVVDLEELYSSDDKVKLSRLEKAIIFGTGASVAVMYPFIRGVLSFIIGFDHDYYKREITVLNALPGAALRSVRSGEIRYWKEAYEPYRAEEEAEMKAKQKKYD